MSLRDADRIRRRALVRWRKSRTPSQWSGTDETCEQVIQTDVRFRQVALAHLRKLSPGCTHLTEGSGYLRAHPLVRAYFDLPGAR